MHLLVSISQEMIEIFYPNKAEARILHVGDDVEGNGEGPCK